MQVIHFLFSLLAASQLALALIPPHSKPSTFPAHNNTLAPQQGDDPAASADDHSSSTEGEGGRGRKIVSLRQSTSTSSGGRNHHSGEKNKTRKNEGPPMFVPGLWVTGFAIGTVALEELYLRA